MVTIDDAEIERLAREIAQRTGEAPDVIVRETLRTALRDRTVELSRAHGAPAWDLLEAMAGTLEGPPDLAAEHDHYLYGVPRRGGNV